MESRRLKNKKQELAGYQKRVVAYAKRQKNPLYMLGDWLLTLCALGIILVEEIYKFFRYRLNLESFSRFLKEDVRWYRVWIHFTLAFLLPVVIFSVGITSQSGSFWSNFYHRLSQGVLFSTTVSLAATLVTDFVENLQPETKSDGRNRSTKRTVYQISVDQATVIGLLLTICDPHGGFLLVYPIRKSRNQFYRVDFTICPLWWSLAFVWVWWTSRCREVA